MSSVPPPPPPPPPPSGDGAATSSSAPKFSKPAGAFAPPPAGNINVPRAPSPPHAGLGLEGDAPESASGVEFTMDALTFLASLAAFVLLYLDLFQKTQG